MRHISVMTSITEFYNDRSIFITGATGFVGKVLVEKLLRSCPQIKNIFILVRPKRGHNARERVKELIKSKVSNSLQSGGYLNAIFA